MVKTAVVKCGINQKNILWSLFKEYHSEIHGYASEQPLPKEELFKDFWFQAGKEVFLLIQNEKVIGFTLLQILQNEQKENYWEMGAIFVRKNNRGFHSLRLYKTAAQKAFDLGLPLTSEIAADNNLSLGVFDSLDKRYSKKSNLNFQKNKMKNSRYFIAVSRL